MPVINGLTNRSHPCQIMADILTFEEHRGAIAGQTIAWVGDGNNVACSWIEAAVRLGFTLNIATPAELAPPAELVDLGAGARGEDQYRPGSGSGGARRALRGDGLLGEHVRRPGVQPAQSC